MEFALVVRDVRCPDAAAVVESGEVQRVGSVEDMADLFPMNQILRVRNDDRREILESGIDEIVILPDTHQRRVGKKSRQHRVVVGFPGLDAAGCRAGLGGRCGGNGPSRDDGNGERERRA